MTTTADIHTTQLTDSCDKRVELTLAGRRFGETTTALYRGQLWHEAAALAHTAGRWDRSGVTNAVLDAHIVVERKAKAENRPFSAAVEKGRNAVMAEVERLLLAYAERVAPRVSKLIGVELPVRLTLDVDGEPAEFASHLDLLFRDERGRLHLDDWKTGADSPSWQYLNRNIQLGLYWLALRHGTVLVDGDWLSFGEWPVVSWIHVNDLAVYGRKTTIVNHETGEEETFEKGQARPLDRIVRTVPFDPAGEAALVEQLRLRVRMRRLGLYPMNPDPTGCMLCECHHWCPSWTTNNGGTHESE